MLWILWGREDMAEIDRSEEKFNINDVLKNVFLKVQMHPQSKVCELIYAMEKTVPRLLIGKVLVLESYLADIFQFLVQYSYTKEILVEVTGPEDFVYVEDIIFTMKDLKLTDADVSNISKAIEEKGNILGAKIYYSPSRELNIYVPLTLSELGLRRHYRLPSKSLLQKNVLIMAQSQNITSSITKMFKYFPYNVDMSMRKFEENTYDLSEYNLLVVEDNLMNETLNEVCRQVQKNHNLKLVILGKANNINIHALSNISTSLERPVTQESIFELIVSIFSDEYDSEQFLKNRKKLKQVEEVKTTQRKEQGDISEVSTVKSSEKDTFQSLLENKKNDYAAILDLHIGKKNTKSLRLNYEDELENFFDMFDGSDLYFRQMVNEKSVHKIKEFCIDLEKYSKIIGAQSMLKFTEIISLIFVYNKIDLLPIYPGRYHIELKKLFKEMEKYFSY